MEYHALVDSGSTASAFPIKIDVELGFTYDGDAAPRSGEVVGGTVEYWVSTNSVELMTEIGPVTLRQVALVRGGLLYPVLGRLDFFNRFKITFDEQAEEAEFTAYPRPARTH